MQIETTRFGALNVEEGNILTFSEGLPGFEECRRFTLVAHRGPSSDKASPFQWLQSLEDETLAFLAMEPCHCFPSYEPRISGSDLEAVHVGNTGLKPRVYTLLSIPKGDPCGITANLLAPVIVNPVTQEARQVVLGGDEYGLRHRLLPGGAN